MPKHDWIFHGCITLMGILVVHRWIWKPWATERYRAFVSEGRNDLLEFWCQHRLPMDNYAFRFLMELFDDAHQRAATLTVSNLLLHIPGFIRAMKEDQVQTWPPEEFVASAKDLPPQAQGFLYLLIFALMGRTMQMIGLGTAIRLVSFCAMRRSAQDHTPLRNRVYPQAAAMALVTETTRLTG